jgi:hypothetical protein
MRHNEHAQFAGALLSPGLSVLVTSWQALFITFIILPYYALTALNGDGSTGVVPASDRRVHVLFMAIIIGLLNGHNVVCVRTLAPPPRRQPYLSTISTPATYVMPMVTGLLVELCGAELAHNRAALVGA